MRKIVSRRALLQGSLTGLAVVAGGCVSARASNGPVLVTGASGRLGRRLVDELLGRGFRVRALVRDRERAAAELPARVTLAVGDLRAPASLAAAVGGMSAIVAAAGATTLDENDANGPRQVDYLGNRNLIAAAGAAGIGRFILVSSQNVTLADRYSWVAMRPLLRWKLEAERALRASELEYTIIRPGQLLEGQDGLHPLLLGQGDELKGPIPRVDLARVCVAALRSRATVRTTFEVASSKAEGATDWSRLFRPLRPDERLRT